MPKVKAAPKVISAGTITGDKVRNLEGRDVGKIEEIMIDIADGRVSYVVVSFGGLLGVGTKLFAVPWNILTLDTDNHQFVMDVDKEKLKDAPGFDKDHWPETGDVRWLDEIYNHYGFERNPTNS